MDNLPKGPGNKNAELISSTVIVYTAAVAAVTARFFCRWRSGVGFWWDDWLVVGALVWVTIASIMTVTVIKDFAGHHIGNTDLSRIGVFGKALYICELVHPLSLTFAKCSVLALYWRIFSVAARWPMIVMGFLCIGWGVAWLFTLMFQCRPISAAWEPLADHSGCLDPEKMLVYGPIPHIIEDAILLLMPLPYIALLRKPLGQQLIIYSMFIVGGFIIVVSILRTIVIKRIDFSSVDLTIAFAYVSIWSAVEVNVSVVCACLPTLRPLVTLVRTGSFGLTPERVWPSTTQRSSHSAQRDVKQSWWTRMQANIDSERLPSRSESDDHDLQELGTKAGSENRDVSDAESGVPP